MSKLVLVARGIRSPRRAYAEVVRRLTYLWGPRLTSSIRKRWVILKNPHAEIRFGKYCRLDPGFSLHMPDGGEFVAGTAVHFRRGFRAEISRGGRVTIGDVCVFSYYSLIQCSTSIEIGDRAMFGQSSMVVDGNHKLKDVSTPIFGQGFEFTPIKIGSDVTTLTKVTVINDIGHKSIVAANSVVNKPVPPYSAVGGVPAKVIDYFGPPELEPPEWRERRMAAGDPDQPPRRGRLEVSGHSIAFGGGVSAFEHRFTTRLAELLDAEEVNRSVAGAIACWQETGADPGDGGYARVLQSFLRPADPEAAHPSGLVGLVNYGVNDLAVLGPDNLDPFRHALRTAISRHRAAAVFEESHPTVSYDGSWTPRPAAGPDCSGKGVMVTAEDGASFTVSVPERFPGGTVALGFVAASGSGARHAFTLDGEPAGVLDTRGITDQLGHRVGAVMRLPGVSPGPHEIVCRVTSCAGDTAFDYWQLESEPALPVLLPLAYPMLDWRPYDGWPHRPTEAGVAALNDLIVGVAAEFGAQAITVDTVSVMRAEDAVFGSAGTYPNDAGHAALARACAAALSAAELAERPLDAEAERRSSPGFAQRG
jgi:acetyltransferase-like isoleucine patch superfamily enzyme